MRSLLALALVAAPAVAHADAIAEGQDLAKRGKFEQAIDKFKQADRAQPSAQTACLIGLGYLRSGHAPEAEVRFAQCRERATPRDPIPDWLEAVDKQLATQVAKLTRVQIDVDTDEPVTVSGWRDDPFTQHVIHLPPGHYELSSGRATSELDVDDERSLRTTLEVPTPEHRATKKPRKKHVAGEEPSEPPTKLSPYLFGAAGAFALIGLGIEVFPLSHARDVLRADGTGAAYDADYPAYQDLRVTVVAFYAAAAVALGIGLYLHHTETSGVRIGASVDPHGGGMVTLGWTR